MDKTDRVLKQFLQPQVNVTATPIAPQIIIPNHSGIASNLDAQNKLAMITAEKKLFLDHASDTYLKYNSTTHEVELYVDGVIKQSW